MHLVEAPTTLSADFDLNCSGKTIDDFIGTAKLYNINLRRHSFRMDLDSINIHSYTENVNKHIDIESNLLSAKIDGNFLLSEIPNSMQFYLSKYLPSYISSSGKIAADQNLNFNIKTRQVNDLLKAFTLYLSGFDSSTLVGNLNTINQTLSIEANVPFGKIGNTNLYHTILKGEGDYKKLNLTSSVQHLIVGNNILNTSLDLNAAVGGDSLNYSIVTKSDQQYGTATIQGKAYAANDTLYMSLLPSEFFVNNTKWDIQAGNRVVYSKNYLVIDNVNLSSSLQKIAVNTDINKPSKPIVIKTTNIDIAQLASLTPYAKYKPEGRVNGEIRVERQLDQLNIKSNLEILGVKILEDSVGVLKINGAYDAASNALLLEPGTGIFNDAYSLSTTGKIFLNNNSSEQINATVQIANFPLKLIQPFLEGYASRVGGTVDGSVDMKGTINNPDFDGSVTLRNVIAKVDYIGSVYSIPEGNLAIKNQTVSLDDIELKDVYNNKAVASGFVKFTSLNNPQININVSSNQFEVVNLRSIENDLFYGNVIAKANFSLVGRLSNMDMYIEATPMQKSHLYLPYNSAGDHSASSYISFKSYGDEKDDKPLLKSKDKLSVNVNAVLNSLLDVTLVLDPISGDQISANGNGNLNISVPANEDYSLFGSYNIDKGKYLFTFRQVLSKEFLINSGSTIVFGGKIDNTRLNVNATYPTRARLYDLLDQNKILQLSSKELIDAQTAQIVNVNLTMKGTLAVPDLSYDIELPEKRSLGTPAYAELNRINTSDKSLLTNQVSSLLFLGSFIPSQGITSTLVTTGAKTTLGETIASQASPLLTSALNKLIGDPKLQVVVQYKSFGQDATSSTAVGPDTRNQVKFGFQRNYFNDRLSLQIGSAYDWGRPTSNNNSTSSFNLAGDFRAQYLLTPDGGLSIVGFRASNYDLYAGDNVSRQGLGITYRKSFDNFYEFIHSKKRIARERQEQQNLKQGSKL